MILSFARYICLMAKWLRQIFFLAGAILLLYHNMVPHHHDDEDDKITHAKHHPNDALEHVKIDHQFYQDFQKHIDVGTVTAIVPTQPDWTIDLMPATLPQTAWSGLDDPHPPGIAIAIPVLRGPPATC